MFQAVDGVDGSVDLSAFADMFQTVDGVDGSVDLLAFADLFHTVDSVDGSVGDQLLQTCFRLLTVLLVISFCRHISDC